MKALSLLQPWATLVATGSKRIETRSWKTKYRGPIAIHASKGFLKGGRSGLVELCSHEPFKSALTNQANDLLSNGLHPSEVYKIMPFGYVIATCFLVDCFLITDENIPVSPELEFGDFAPGRYGWSLQGVEMLKKPIPFKGKLGLWNWDWTVKDEGVK